MADTLLDEIRKDADARLEARKARAASDASDFAEELRSDAEARNTDGAKAPLAASPAAPEPEQGLGMFDSFTDKLAFGHGDTLEGAEAYIGAMFTGEDPNDAYRRARDAFRQRRLNYAIRNPVKNAIGEIGGAVGGAVALGNAGATFLPARPMSLPSAAARGGLEGGAYAAAHAHGAADGQDPFGAALRAFPQGAAVGAIMTPALQAFHNTFFSGADALNRVPSSAQLRRMGQAAYRNLERRNPIYRLGNADYRQLLLRGEYEAGMYPRVDTIMNRMSRDAQNGVISFNKLQSLRTSLGKLAAGAGDDAVAARRLRSAIDVFREANAPTGEVARAIRIWHTHKKAAEVDFSSLRGDVMAARSGSGGNDGNTARQAVAAPYLKEMDPTKARRGWSAAEVSAMERAIFSGSHANRPGNAGLRAGAHRLARKAGGLSPEKGALPLWGGVLSGQQAAMTGNPLWLLPSAFGAVGKRAADAMTANNARLFEATVKNFGMAVPTTSAMGPVEQALIRVLSDPEARENVLEPLRRSGLLR